MSPISSRESVPEFALDDLALLADRGAVDHPVALRKALHHRAFLQAVVMSHSL